MNINILLFLLSFLLLTACKDDKDVDCSTFHWSYEGDSGPQHWATCSSECGGQAQSPIDITGAVTDNTLPPLSLHYEPVPIDLIHDGHSIKFQYAAGSNILHESLTYNLAQFHFHTQSEHTIAGQYYPLEVHLVHEHMPSGNLVVLGILFETGTENAFLQQFINDLPEEKDDHFTSAQLVNVLDVLPADQSYYTYPGSLTTPPCAETVTWLVLKTPVEISNAQLQRFIGILEHNYRPVQPLFSRQIRASS